METKTVTLKDLKDAVRAFGGVASGLAAYGAADTEPLAHFQVALVRAIRGEKVPPPTADEWELYTVSRDCTKAAEALNAALAIVVECAHALSDSIAARRWVRGYCEYVLDCGGDYADDEEG